MSSKIPVSKKNPLISIIMPAYNAQNNIEEAIQSIIRQTYSNFELIIVNDGSIDDTQKIIDKYKKLDPRIKSYSQKNKGVVAAANKAASYAKGEYITRHDADDVSFNTKLEDYIKSLNKNPDAIIITGNIEVIDEKGLFIRKALTPPTDKLLKDTLYVYNPLPNGATLVRKDVFDKVGQYSDVFAEDLHLWIKLHPIGKFISTNTFVYKWRINLSGLTHTNQDKTLSKEREYCNTLWDENGPPGYISRQQLLRQCNELLRIPEGVHHKNTYLYTLSRISSRLIKKGYKKQGIKQLMVIVSTGRTGAKIALNQILLSVKGYSKNGKTSSTTNP